MANPPSTTPKMTRGPINAVVCPHCGRGVDLRGEQETLDKEAEYDCDHCSHVFEVVAVATVKIVTVRQSQRFRGPVKRPTPVRPGTTIDPRRLRR